MTAAGIQVGSRRYSFGIRQVDVAWVEDHDASVGVLLLGPPQIDGGGVLAPRDRVVLATLAVRRRNVVSADQIAEAIWGDRRPSSWSKQVQICIGRLRKVLGVASIETVAGGYLLRLGGDDVDLDRFEQLVTKARVQAATGGSHRASATFATALGLWRGPPFDDLDGWEPARSEVARLEELRRSVEEELLDARLAAGEHRDVSVTAEALVAAEPLRERRWAILAVAQYRCGRQADALRSLARARRLLVDELGVDPGSELVQLEAAILRQDEQLAAPSSPGSGTESCPYKGLASYDGGDADWFFGRTAEVAACAIRLRSTRLLVIAGPSGCGKSSLARAGLVPALQREGREVAVFVPGRDPNAAMTAALAASGRPLVLVVDQFEELFTVEADASVTRAFCSRLTSHATEQSPVVLCVRADYLAALSIDSQLARLVEQGLHLVTPLQGDRLREAIEQPAAQAGLRLEPGLVDLLERDTDGEPGALPLLSHAMVETWRRRDGLVLTVDGYRATGGIRGAVARSADRLYDSLSIADRATLRGLFLRLVTPSMDGDPMGCRLPTAALVGDRRREQVVALLIRERLLTAEADTVELAHEALARAWPRLQTWLDEDDAGQRILRHVAAAATGWDSLRRPESELYRGARLDTALEWRTNAKPDLTDLEVAFLDASKQRATTEQTTLLARAELENRQNRRLRSALVGVALLAAVALVAALVAYQQRQQSDAQRHAAQIDTLSNRSLALRSTDRDVAALLAVEAYRRAPDDPGAYSALLGTVTASPGFAGYTVLPAGSEPLAGAIVPGGHRAVVAVGSGDLVWLDLETGETERLRPLDRESVPPANPADSIVRISADGRRVAQLLQTDTNEKCFDIEAVRATDGEGCAALVVYNITTGDVVFGPVTPPMGPGDVAINADGSLVAVAGGYTGDAIVYQTDSGTIVGVVDGLPRPGDSGLVRDTAALAFGPDGLLYLGSTSGPVRSIDPTTMAAVDRYDAPPMATHVNLVATSGFVLGSGADRLVAIDIRTGMLAWSVPIGSSGDPSPCPFFAVAAPRERFYCGDVFGAIEERDLTTGQLTGRQIEPQQGSGGNLAISDDGTVMLAFGADAAVVSKWRLDDQGPVVEQARPGWVATGYDPSGQLLLVLTSLDPPDLAVWDPESGDIVDELTGVVNATWFTPTMLGAIYADGTAGPYDVRAHSRLDALDDELQNAVGELIGAWVPPGGERVHIGFVLDQESDTPRCRVQPVDLKKLEFVDPMIEIEDCVWVAPVSATADGTRVAVTHYTPTDTIITTLHDGRDGKVLADPLIGPEGVSIGPDGMVVGGYPSGEVTQFDIDTLDSIGAFPGARGQIDALEFSADGKLLLVGWASNDIAVYDVATRTRLGDTIAVDAPVLGVGDQFIVGAGGPLLRPDGSAIVVNGNDGIAIWAIDRHSLAENACRLAGRNLTHTEWDTFLADLGRYRPTCPEHET